MEAYRVDCVGAIVSPNGELVKWDDLIHGCNSWRNIASLTMSAVSGERPDSANLRSESRRARSHHHDQRVRSYSRDATASLEYHLPHTSICAAIDLTGCGDRLEDRRSARVEMEACRLGDVPHPGGLEFRPGQVWRTKISHLEEACSAISARHGLAQKLAGNGGVCRGRGFRLRLRPAQGQSTARAEHAGRRPSPASGEASDRDSRWP